MMGPYDGAEICELVGLFMLNLVVPLSAKKVGLYMDDGLAILENAPGLNLECVKKKMIKLFQQYGLNISVDTNLAQTDFLEVTLL